ncbi:hypothetical protein [Sphaerotilus mobilis]|uniref:Uncharacterized protein n=1 Tax=Sphaerotilus mobilis TaxID=47994 RepID=A0A4V2EX08_9BURK|nr:hypothetical protein [Sphaerotilus mobilis]RZS57840.1 hypothetical protein EV685_0113 [Sphaerotilus mobilis]
MSRASPRRVQRAPGRVAPQRRLPKAVLPDAVLPDAVLPDAVQPETAAPVLEPVHGPTLTLFDPLEAHTPASRRRGRPRRAEGLDDPVAATGLREQPWPVSRRRGEATVAKAAVAHAATDERPAVVIPETCLSLLRANDRHELPCPLVANAYRTEDAAEGPLRVLAKVNAPQRLREALRRPGLVARPIQLGTLADPYLDVEREQRLTRALLEILAEARHPVGLLTASPAVVRDLDLLADLASRQQALVLMRITPEVCPLGLVGEPATAPAAPAAAKRGRKAAPVVPAAPGAPQRDQLAASPWLNSLARLAAAGVPVGVVLDLAADGLDTRSLLAPDGDPARRAAWLALFTQLRAAGATLWRCPLPTDRLADALALGDLAAAAGLSGPWPTLDVRPFVAPAAVLPSGPRQVTLF